MRTPIAGEMGVFTFVFTFVYSGINHLALTRKSPSGQFALEQRQQPAPCTFCLDLVINP